MTADHFIAAVMAQEGVPYEPFASGRDDAFPCDQMISCLLTEGMRLEAERRRERVFDAYACMGPKGGSA